MMADTSLFNIVHDNATEEKDLVLPGTEPMKPVVDSILETPKPGFCVKTRSEDGQKVFLNICTSDKINEPPDISETELQRILETEDVGKFRVPLSAGPPHAEVDKSGAACTAYDLVIHPSFCTKVRQQEAFMQFLLTAILTIIEQKHDVKLSYESCVLLKNKQHLGRLEPQLMRMTKKPFVVELDSQTSIERYEQAGNAYTQLPCKKCITVEPQEGQPEFVVVEVESLHMKSVKWLQLDIGEDRIELLVRPGGYRLDLDLPHWVYAEQGGAQFHCQTKTLTITLPVQAGEG
eukprot:scpid39563/ scgid17026/ PIH1 domain-containing protein 1